jgi:hypothetical protein
VSPKIWVSAKRLHSRFMFDDPLIIRECWTVIPSLLHI